MRTVKVGVGLFIVGVIAACSSAPDETGAESSSDALSYACSITGKQQNDGSKCQWENCGATSAAMMRDAMTCGAENYSGGTMRTYYDEQVGLPSGSCASHLVNGSPAGTGTTPAELGALLEDISKYDHGANYASTTTFYSSVSLSTLKSRMSSGYVAVLGGGSTSGGAPAAPCGFEGGHSIFVHHYDPSTDKFLVYDPCCSSTCTSHYNGKKSPQWWPASSLDNWRWGDATIGKGASPPIQCGTATCPAGDYCWGGTRCCNPNYCTIGCPR